MKPNPSKDNDKALFANDALLTTGWQKNVRLWITESGHIARIDSGVEFDIEVDSERHPYIIPGMPNLHSHAFQIALRGRTQKKSNPNDDFFTWRSAMYNDANKITPQAMETLATQLYIEMLKAGYTSVAEFNYVHHQPDGTPYPEYTKMSDSLISAAKKTGIKITLLPTMYERAGLAPDQSVPLAKQKRFVNSASQYLELLKTIKENSCNNTANVNIGVALHSIRAVSKTSMKFILNDPFILNSNFPIHIHIAEPENEVNDSLKHYNKRPVEWFLHFLDTKVPQLDQQRIILIHATQMTQEETKEVAKRKIVIGFCPTTEADLGDGISQAKLFVESAGIWGIGSDQNGTINPFIEIYLLETSQRLLHHRRIVLGDGDSLYQSAVEGGSKALGFAKAGLCVGASADLLSLNPSTNPSFTTHSATEQLLDQYALAPQNHNPIHHVMVSGKWVIRNQQLQTISESAISARYNKIIQQLQEGVKSNEIN